MAFLTVQPVWSTRPLTGEEIQITNTLHALLQMVTSSRASVVRQVSAVRAKMTNEPITTFTGTLIDDLFKQHVQAAVVSGKLPKNLQVTPRGKRGPDVLLGRVAWDVTTAEAGRDHIKRDVLSDRTAWDAYLVLGY